MPLEISCPSCQAKFRAPEKYAGKKIKCPKCQGVIAVPGAAPSGSGGAAPTAPKKGPPKRPAAAPTAPTPAKEEWYLQTEEGEQYGPVTREEMDAWAAEGRLDASCQVLCEGWEQWKWAEEVYPEIAGGGEQEQAAEENPFAGIAAGTPQQEANPFAAPQQTTPSVSSEGGSASGEAYTPTMTRALAETRPWVLFLSILGFIGAGFGALGGLIYGLLALVAIFNIGALGLILLLFALVITGGAALYFFAAYHLYRYASESAIFIRTKNTNALERALLAQKSFWKLVGIVTAVYLAAIPVMLILVSVVAGGLGALMR